MFQIVSFLFFSRNPHQLTFIKENSSRKLKLLLERLHYFHPSKNSNNKTTKTSYTMWVAFLYFYLKK